MNKPSVPKRPHSLTHHGDTRVDPYYWLMDRASEEVLSHLRSENEFLKEELKHLEPLTEELFQEMKNRIEETDNSVPSRKRSWWHYSRTVEGLQYPIVCRLKATSNDYTPPTIDPQTPIEGEEIVIDMNVEAGDSDFFSVGVLAISFDDKWLAVGTDFEGNERHRVTFRSLVGETAPDDVIEDVHYGSAWSTDSKYFFYTRVDDAWRPYQLWRHKLGTDASQDVLVFQEDNLQFNVGIGRSRDDKIIVVALSSSMTTECYWLPADNPTAELQLIEARRHGIEYSIDHFTDKNANGWWLKVTNEDAVDFRCLAKPVSGGEWKEIIPHQPGNRLDGIDAFANFFTISTREDGYCVGRIVKALKGDDPFGDDFFARSQAIDSGAKPSTLNCGGGEYDTPFVRISVTSLVTPAYIADINVETGERFIRKQQKVLGGYDESNYVTTRLWTTASDGQRLPISLVARRDLVDIHPDGSMTAKKPSPFLLYGYGSYEVCIDPYFSVSRLSMLDRGVIYAIAHIRGGGEMGRNFYLQGKLNQKPTTFSDFVAITRDLIAKGWTTPAQLAGMGGSAGGLLMGGVVNLAPELYKAVVADVAFVDALTSMLDETLPLTAGEWEEWGDPITDEVAYKVMKSYSPYDNVSATNADGSTRVYPHMYVTGGLNDSRVGFWEPTKYVLKLRDVNPQNVVYLKTEMGAGHGGPSGRYDSWRDGCQESAFVLSELNATTTI